MRKKCKYCGEFIGVNHNKECLYYNLLGNLKGRISVNSSSYKERQNAYRIQRRKKYGVYKEPFVKGEMCFTEFFRRIGNRIGIL